MPNNISSKLNPCHQQFCQRLILYYSKCMHHGYRFLLCKIVLYSLIHLWGGCLGDKTLILEAKATNNYNRHRRRQRQIIIDRPYSSQVSDLWRIILKCKISSKSTFHNSTNNLLLVLQTKYKRLIAHRDLWVYWAVVRHLKTKETATMVTNQATRAEQARVSSLPSKVLSWLPLQSL